MQGNASQVEWYLARNGQRYGPLSEQEFRKFIELGHLKPTDLVWREGFAEWRLASIVFPQRAHPQVHPQTADPGQDQAQPYGAGHGHAQQRPLQQGHAPQAQAQQAQAQQGMPRPQRHPGARGPEQARTGSPHQTPGPREQAQMRGPRAPGRDAASASDRQDRRPQRPEPTPEQQTVAADGAGRRRSSGRLRRMLVAAVLLVTVGAGVWLLLTKSDQLMALIGYGQRQATRAATVSQPAATTPPTGARMETAATASGPAEFRFNPSETAIDSEMQKTPLWRLVRSEFPDWYAKRVQEAEKLRAEKRDEKLVFKTQLAALVDLRRKYQADALGSSLPRLRSIAATFLGNVTHLRKVSADACFGYISQGETSPAVVDLMQASDQLTSVFEAVSEGRKTPRAYPAPKPSDFDVLAQELSARGWKEADMQLFADPKALSREKPERVCQMLQDWFTAQLAVKDPDIQLRLLVDALRPVVAG